MSNAAACLKRHAYPNNVTYLDAELQVDFPQMLGIQNLGLPRAASA
jgi:hypothetical protein